jgi:hypothetical protein
MATGAGPGAGGKPAAPSNRLPTPPIDAQMWERMRQLDRRCAIALSRGRPNGRQWARAAKTWQVQIQREPGQIIDTVYIENPRLADALAVAVAEAERRGWAG